MRKKHFIYADKSELVLGTALVVFTFFMPLLFNVENFGIMHSLRKALLSGEKADLLRPALMLVLLNTLRAAPHYVGAFFIGESLHPNLRHPYRSIVSAAMTLLSLLLVYGGIEKIHGIHYDFGLPAFIVSGFVILFGRLGYRYISRFRKAALTVLMLAAFQFLDIMPLAKSLPVGRGEISVDIKLAAAVLDAEPLINAAAIAGMVLLFLFGFILLLQYRAENSLRKLADLETQNQEIRLQARTAEIQNRTYREMQYLVHDLKSPLTAIQAITGILRMERESGIELDMKQEKEYFDRIETAVDQMSGMISEILYEQRRSCVSTQSLINIVLSQASVTEYAPYLKVENTAPEKQVLANRILFPRVIQNLLKNAAQATEGRQNPQILLSVTAQTENGAGSVRFTVSDNGRGLPEASHGDIWAQGVSGKNSSGLGLAFVKKVVEEMDGSVSARPGENGGAIFEVLLPEAEEEADE